MFGEYTNRGVLDGWRKCKVIPSDVMQTYKGSEGLAPFIHDIDTRRRKVVSFMLKRPCSY